MTSIILDTDPGIDDAMAIFYAMADPELELLGMTTVFGNVFTPDGTRNALALCELAGQDIPVAEGAHVPLIQPQHPPADFVHGKNGLGNANVPETTRKPDPRPAHQFIAETLAARPGEVTIVAVGPLTNIALALQHHPEITETAKNVVVMGGAARTPGNVNVHAEANIWNDPHAAEIVFSADWNVTMVGLDVTERIRCTINACFLHDPSAIICAQQPELFEIAHSPITMRVEGAETGRTVESPGGKTPPVKICIEAKVESVRARFLEHLTSGKLP